MPTNMAEVHFYTTVHGHSREATGDIEIPEGTSWESVADLSLAFAAGYARLWGVPPDTVRVSVALVQTDRKLLRYGDVLRRKP